jgi:PAS domain S-box-containing protein
MTERLKVLTETPAPERTEEALDLCEQALDVLTEGVFLFDLTRPDTPIVYANQALGRLTGYAPEEFIGQPYSLLQGPDSNPAVFAEIQTALQEQRGWSGELLIYRKDGTTAWHEFRLVEVPDTAGHIRHGIGVQTDVTEHKNLQERLRQVQKMASLGFLAGGIAHDFNNLLTAIIAYSDILLTSSIPNPVREGLEKIKEAGERGATLTGQLLAFSRKQLPRPRLLDLRSVLADMNSLLRRLVGEHIDLVNVIDPALGPVEIIPGQIEQILLNLVVNARDAMPNGGTITIEMATAYPDARRTRGPSVIRPGPYLLLAVTDTGCGMSAEVLAELFQPLFTTKEAGQGTGLGLFTVHEIVKQNDGLIAVASRPGQGTRVEIFLPRREDSSR